MSYHTGYNIRDIFAEKYTDIFEGVPINLNVYMAGHRLKK